jgi:replication factor C subunit 3/5
MNSSFIDPCAPKSYKDLVGNGAIFNHWSSVVKEKKATHVLWVGPIGIGKSTFWRLVVPPVQLLTINCYSDAGLREQRDSIKHFIRLSSGCSISPSSSTNQSNSDEKQVNSKTIRYILFEHAEVLSDDAQAFLRRMLEVYSSSIFCIFEVRDATAITDPISSRCQIVQLSPLDAYEVEYELHKRIPSLDPRKLQLLSKFANGNLRWALFQGFGSHIGFSVQDLGLVPPVLKKTDLRSIVEWEMVLHDDGYDPRIGLTNTLPASIMELWRRIMETPGGVHTRSQTIIMALEGLTSA